MSDNRITHGELPAEGQLQPGFALTEHNDGTIQGHAVYITAAENILLLPQLEALHPQDNRCEITKRHLVWKANGLLEMTAEYFGIVEDPTDKQISYVGTPDRERIETHPDFATELAGTLGAPLNGADFDPTRGNFRGFLDPENALFGVQFYLRATTQVTLTWWTATAPDLGRRMQIVDSVPPFKKPADVGDFLIIDLPYRKIGNFYQMTQLVLGSGEDGWNELVYPQT